MIRLNNVSKFYYSKGIIASGITKVNLELNVGEFVVITGESGSGKSTLLNVISGLDTYEEGEMYIDGIETSHYTSGDFEQYRKKYIGNIFQNFNLINSYTVYQNVELILLIKGCSKEETKAKVPEIIQKVGLTEYTNTKASKLSGGQKQRVSIARALAKETSVIVADEPTGNLDTVSAQGIVQLLKELAKDRLIIVVTHNFDQFADQATRVIKMHDGRVVEDKSMAHGEEKTPALQPVSSREITGGSVVRLGTRNTFNILTKFFLLLIVFLFVTLAISSQYTSFAKQKDEMAKLGFNSYFSNTDTSRIVLKKTDKTAFTDEDYARLAKMKNIKSVVKEDIVLDANVMMEKENFIFSGYPADLQQFKGKPDKGVLPKGDNEVLLEGPDDGYSLPEDILGKEIDMTYQDTFSKKMKVVGIKYIDAVSMTNNGKVYMTPAATEELTLAVYQTYSETKVTIDGKIYKAEMGMPLNRVVPNKNIDPGEALVTEEMHYQFTSGWAIGKDIDIRIKTPYFSDGITVKIDGTYNKDNWEKKTGLKDFELHSGEIYVNPADFKSMFDNGNFQSSVYVSDLMIMDETKEALADKGYEPLVIADTLVKFIDTAITDIVRVPLVVILVLALFFIAYFVIRLIMKSRAVYFTILRILGMSRKKAKQILDLEFFIIINIAYVIFLGVVALAATGVIGIPFMQDLVTYLRVRDYIFLYLALVVLAYLISSKFARSIFKKSAMDAYREEA